MNNFNIPDQHVERPPLEQTLRGPQPDPAAVDAMLDEWMRGDAEEQRETLAALRRGLDEDRPEGYKLFPHR